MSTARIFPLVLICALPALVPAAAGADGVNAASPLFSEHGTVAVHIRAPLAAVMKQRDDGDYHDGTFEYVEDDGSTRTLDLKLRARGRYRRQSDICRFAPLRLNFSKKQVKGTLLDGQDKLKLVTHCQTTRSVYEQYLLKEYLSYRILQTLTDNSFSARLLRVTWIDSEKPDDAIERYAFLIEDDDLLAERLGLTVSKAEGIRLRNLEPSQASLVSVFQYLIGNTDYSLLRGPADEECCHNAVLLERETGPYLPVPYDFDFSGFVSTSYAKPNPRLSIRSVRARLYRGYCELNGELPATLQRFRDGEAAVRELIANQDGLDRRMADQALKFVDKFYETINDPSRVERYLVKKCV